MAAARTDPHKTLKWQELNLSKIDDLPERDSAEAYPALKSKLGDLKDHPSTCDMCMIVASSKMGIDRSVTSSGGLVTVETFYSRGVFMSLFFCGCA